MRTRTKLITAHFALDSANRASSTTALRFFESNLPEDGLVVVFALAAGGK